VVEGNTADTARYRSYRDRDLILHPKMDVASPSARREGFSPIWRSEIGGLGVLILQFRADKSCYLMVVQRAQLSQWGMWRNDLSLQRVLRLVRVDDKTA
jgi:hypothetical protein